MLAGIFGFATGLVGTILSATFEQLPAGPIIVLTGTALFLVSLLFGLRRGVIARLIEHVGSSARGTSGSSCGRSMKLREGSVSSRRFSPHSFWTTSRGRRGSSANCSSRRRPMVLVAAASGRLRTDAGLDESAPSRSTRGQRLWEAFLTEYPDQAGERGEPGQRQRGRSSLRRPTSSELTRQAARLPVAGPRRRQPHEHRRRLTVRTASPRTPRADADAAAAAGRLPGAQPASPRRWCWSCVTRPVTPASSRDLAVPLWTMLVGIVCNTSCAILGCYLVLRRMSLLGDAISHAVLPGIVIGFLFSGSVAGLPICSAQWRGRADKRADARPSRASAASPKTPAWASSSRRSLPWA